MEKEKQKTDVELLSEAEQELNYPLGAVSKEVALKALSIKSNQLQATVDELKQRCEELEKYVVHETKCNLTMRLDPHYYRFQKCGNCNEDAINHRKDENKLVCKDGKTFEFKCTCKLDQLLTPNERK